MGVEAFLSTQIIDSTTNGRTLITVGDYIPSSLLGSGTPDSSSYLRGDGAWSEVDLTPYVPYVGATGNVDLGSYDILASGATFVGPVVINNDIDLRNQASPTYSRNIKHSSQFGYDLVSSSTGLIKYWSGYGPRYFGMDFRPNVLPSDTSPIFKVWGAASSGFGAANTSTGADTTCDVLITRYATGPSWSICAAGGVRVRDLSDSADANLTAASGTFTGDVVASGDLTATSGIFSGNISCGAVTASGSVVINNVTKGFGINDGTNRFLIYHGTAKHILHSYNPAWPWAVNCDAGFQVKNTANNANAPLTCGNVTAASGTFTGDVVASGNIGIGQSSPQYDLHFRDDAEIRMPLSYAGQGRYHYILNSGYRFLIGGSNTSMYFVPQGTAYTQASMTLYDAKRTNMNSHFGVGYDVDPTTMPTSSTFHLWVKNKAGIGYVTPNTATLAAALNVQSTTEQLRLEYDASNAASFTVSDSGNLTIAPSGGATTFTGDIVSSGDLTATSGIFSGNISCGAVTASGNLTVGKWYSPVDSDQYLGMNGVGYVAFFDNAGLEAFRAGGNGFSFHASTTKPFGWSNSSNPGSALSVGIYRDADQILAQRNGLNAQTHRIYGTYASSTSGEWLDLKATGSAYEIGSAIGSTGGTARDVKIGHRDGAGTFTSRLEINTNGDNNLYTDSGNFLKVSNGGTMTTNAGMWWVWSLRSRILAPAFGQIQFDDSNATGSIITQYGGTTSAEPAIKRNAAALDFRLADDSGYCNIAASGATFNGSVGIGVVTTSADLDVRGVNRSAASTGMISSISTSTAGGDRGGTLTFGGTYNTGGSLASWAGIAGRKENTTDNNYAAYLQFCTRANGASMAEVARLTSAGNFGIGTSSPTVISGTIRSVDLQHTGGSYYLAGNGTIVGQLGVDVGSLGVFVGARSNHYVAFTTNNTERMRLDTSGKLTIIGDIAASGATFSGDISASGDIVFDQTGSTIKFVRSGIPGEYGTITHDGNDFTINAGNWAGTDVTLQGQGSVKLAAPTIALTASAPVLTAQLSGASYLTIRSNDKTILDSGYGGGTAGLSVQVAGVEKVFMNSSGNTTFRGDVVASGNLTATTGTITAASGIFGDNWSTPGITGPINAIADAAGNLFVGRATSAGEYIRFVAGGAVKGFLGSGAVPMVFDNGTNNVAIQYANTGKLLVGTSSATGGKLQVLSTTEQLRLEYDASNAASFTVNSAGNLTVAPSGGFVTFTSKTVTGSTAQGLYAQADNSGHATLSISSNTGVRSAGTGFVDQTAANSWRIGRNTGDTNFYIQPGYIGSGTLGGANGLTLSNTGTLTLAGSVSATGNVTAVSGVFSGSVSASGHLSIIKSPATIETGEISGYTYLNVTTSQTNAGASINTYNDASTRGYLYTYGTAEGNTTFGVTRANYSFLLHTGGNGLGIGTIETDPIIFGTNNTERGRFVSTGELLLGATSTSGGKLQVRSTTEQLRLEYDASNFTSFTTGVGGKLTVTPSNGQFSVSGSGTFTGDLIASGNLIISALSTYDTEDSNAPSGTTQNINWSLGNNQKLDVSGASGDLTVTFTDPTNPCHLMLKVVQGGTARDITWPAGVKWDDTGEPTWNADTSKTRLVGLYFDGTDYYAAPSETYT